MIAIVCFCSMFSTLQLDPVLFYLQCLHGNPFSCHTVLCYHFQYYCADAHYREQALQHVFEAITNKQPVAPTALTVQMGRKLQVEKAGVALHHHLPSDKVSVNPKLMMKSVCLCVAPNESVVKRRASLFAIPLVLAFFYLWVSHPMSMPRNSQSVFRLKPQCVLDYCRSSWTQTDQEVML
jgi:hypothetical protein